MQAYQQEYLENIQALYELTIEEPRSDASFSSFYADSEQMHARKEQLSKRNMELLQTNLLPQLDGLHRTDDAMADDLEAFADAAMRQVHMLDVGLSAHVYRTLVNYARHNKDTDRLIRLLYKLGLSRFYLYQNLLTLDWDETIPFVSRMRLCFAEAGAYLKYYDELENEETRGYIIRALANTSLGPYSTCRGKISVVKHTLQVLNDEEYRKRAPSLPWDAFVRKTHEQMTRAIRPGLEPMMTPEDVQDILESAHLLYEEQINAAETGSKRPSTRDLLPHYSIEFLCGLLTLEDVLDNIEDMIARSDPTDYSSLGIHDRVLLPGFYFQYLTRNPSLIPPRKDYIRAQYQSILHYLDNAPPDCDHRLLYRQLSQLFEVFLEVEDSLTYHDFLLKLMKCIAPDLYVHSDITGRIAATLCDIILTEDPTFFDDIDFIRDTPADEKRRTAMVFAHECGWFHDTGEITLLFLYTLEGRQWLSEEYEISRFHTLVSYEYLSRHPSTKKYADIGLGHHRWYDGKQGYPPQYKRSESPYRQMVDVIMLSDWLASPAQKENPNNGNDRTPAEAVRSALALSGKRFSPMVTAYLRKPDVVQKICEVVEKSRKEAYHSLYVWQHTENRMSSPEPPPELQFMCEQTDAQADDAPTPKIF